MYISDVGLCGEADNVDETKIYGIMPYVAPEVSCGKPYTQAADIYNFVMVMYFVTGRQHFENRAQDHELALNICNRIRLPKFDNWNTEKKEILKQFKKADEYRKANHSPIKNNQSIIHPESRILLNPFTQDFHYSEVIDFTELSIANKK
ncbi:hypothetical protein C1645_865035 [Glomus cerebriforme]|uniref:Protein kinase domain-containing protein n=1 Tax=Glomus cerebriforme TaxID=658196 RepID=A0A397T946_9GLOM|nr:hypothetical protein C1645_865035 [Glomus cerebriforme]